MSTGRGIAGILAGRPEAESAPEDLARQAKGGDAGAFEELVKQFERRLFTFLYQLVGNQQDAEDLAQETFLKLYRSLERYCPERSFAAWAFTIAKRTAISHFRALPPRTVPDLSEGADWVDPAVRLEQKDQSAALWALARRLKPKQFEALWLRYGEGFSIAETAQIMSLHSIHVKVILHRARTQLRRSLLANGNWQGGQIES